MRLLFAVAFLSLCVLSRTAEFGEPANSNPSTAHAKAKAAANPSASDNAKGNVNDMEERRVLVVGSGQSGIWLNFTEVVINVEPIIRREAKSGGGDSGNVTEAIPTPTGEDRRSAAAVFEKVQSALKDAGAKHCSAPDGWSEGPFFQPNITALKAFRRILIERAREFRGMGMGMRMGMARRHHRNRMSLSPSGPFGSTLKHHRMRTGGDAEDDSEKAEHENENDRAGEGESDESSKENESKVRDIDPRSLFTFAGFRFSKPLRCAMPLSKAIDLVHHLRELNSTIASVKLMADPTALKAARELAAERAMKNALAVADAALGAADLKRSGVSTVIIDEKPMPDLPAMHSGALLSFGVIKPILSHVQSTVTVGVTF